MLLRHILAATDESDAGRQAVQAAVSLAARCSASVTLLRVIAARAVPRFAGVTEGGGPIETSEEHQELERMRRWVGAGVLTEAEMERVQFGVASGIPGIEICRYADRKSADLVVLGRKAHTPMSRLLLGDTADAVARRNRVPTLIVPPAGRAMNTILVALDGSDRGMIVLREACDFAARTGARLHAVTVELAPLDEPWQLGSVLPLTRSDSLRARISEIGSKKGLPVIPLAVGRGDIPKRVVAEAEEIGADVIALGYHRGGSPGILESGSTARRLAHAAPCGVLTIPL